MHCPRAANPRHGALGGFTLHAALLMSFLCFAAGESDSQRDSRSNTWECQSLEAQHANNCPLQPPVSEEAGTKILLQTSSSLLSSVHQEGNAIRTVSEHTQSTRTVGKQFPEEQGGEEEDNSAAGGEEALGGQKAKKTRSKQPLDRDREMRPHSDSNETELVQFGMYVKQFNGMNLVAETFRVDLVLTIRWLDQRVRKILPEGQKSLSLPTKRAKNHIWLPDVIVTNRALKGFDVISSIVTISDSGVVTKTERIIVSILAAFDVSAFPFDTQVLRLRVASSSYMTDELQLSVLENADLSGLDADIFNISGFRFNSVKAGSFVETDASLQKSRGFLDVSITRDHRSVFGSVMVPEILLLFISWSVFFFPMLPPFVMPRVATSLISLLSSMTLAVRTSGLLPPKRSGFVWIEFFQESCQTLMLCTVCLNIWVEVIYHEWKFTELASKMTDELKYIYACLIFLVGALCFWGYLRSGEPDGLAPVVLTTRSLLFVSLVCYLAWGSKRVRGVGCSMPADA